MPRKLVRDRSGAVRMHEVLRVVPFTSIRAAGDGAEGDGRTLDGFASVFNAVTIIDAWEGRFKEQFLPGSMKRSFARQTPIIQFDHGQHPMIGSLPVARFEPGYPREETDPQRAPDGGARVLARMHESPLFEPLREVIATGTVNGMSIRFAPVRERWYRPDGTQVKDTGELQDELMRTWWEDVPDEELLRRDILESGVAEMGPVVWPAYTTTSVGVRSQREIIRLSAGPTRAANDEADANVITQAMAWFTAVDSIVDEAQEALAAYLEVPSPDPDDADEAASASRRRLHLPKISPAATEPAGPGGEGTPDAKRQAVDASPTPTRRQKARQRTLRSLGIDLGTERNGHHG